MDKNNTRKIRIDATQQTAENTGMEDIYEELLDTATRMAYRHFVEPSDEHIECVYLRLVKNREWGLGYVGAVTVH